MGTLRWRADNGENRLIPARNRITVAGEKIEVGVKKRGAKKEIEPSVLGVTIIGSPEKRVLGGEAIDGRDVWYLSSNGRTETIVTSATSTRAMDQAMVMYGDALKRLAKK